MNPLDSMVVFDRSLVRRRRDRAARDHDRHAFLFHQVSDRLLSRLEAVRRTFPAVLELGCRDGHLGRAIAGRRGTELVVKSDLAPAMARLAGDGALVADEEFLPFNDCAFDLVVSNMALHWVNDLPGTLVQINRCLKPDGFFLASLVGGGTLAELRHCLLDAELMVCGGASPRVSPFADLRDAAALLQRAGFALPVADCETIRVTYRTPFDLLGELRRMGSSNALLARRRSPPPRRLFLEAARLYQERHAETDGRVAATVEILYLAGWAPDPGQPRPLRPGTARHRLADALGTVEQPAGDPVGPKCSDSGT